MRKILLLIIPLLVIAGLSRAQITNLSVSNFFAGGNGCNLSPTRSVSVGLENVGTTDLSGVSFNLSYTINGGVPITEIVNVPVFPSGQTYTYTFTATANLSNPGIYNFVSYSSGLGGDLDQTNDTTSASVENRNSVGGTVTSDDTVCQGLNGGTLNLNGQVGTVQIWQSSLNSLTWTNIPGTAGLTMVNYNNLGDTTYYRALVQNLTCALDSSAYATITVTPIPLLSSSLTDGVCSGSLFTYIPTSTVPGSTFTWSRDSVAHITPVSSSGTGNISETLFNDTSQSQFTYYNIITTANGCTNSGETLTVRVDSIEPGPIGPIITGETPVCQNTQFNGPYTVDPLSSDTTAWYSWSYINGGSGESASFGSMAGLGTGTSIFLDFSATATSGDLIVSASNYCGNGPASPPYPIVVETAALVNAGPADSICQSPTPVPYVLSGSSVGGPPGLTASWKVVVGGGTLNNTGLTTMPDTVQYTPAANYAGPVILRLVSDDPIGVCNADSVQRLITIDTAAVVIAAGPDNVCQSATPLAIPLSGSSVAGPDTIVATWSILSGGGTLSSLTATNMPDTVTYTPAANFAGSDTLLLTSSDPGTSCGVVIAMRIINIDSFAIVSAGADTTICAGSSYTLAGSRAGGATTSTWTTTGDGTFNDSSLVNAIYTPGVLDTASGSVILIITTDDPAGPCSFVLDSMILTIEPEPFVSAGIDDTICAGSTYTLSGSFGGTAIAATWTTSGDGTFNDSSLVNAIYTPGVNDTTLGSVYLIFTTNDPPGVCTAVFDSLLLIINDPAAVSAGTDTAVCAGSGYTLAGSRTGGASASTWTTTGDGVFSDSSLVNAVYTPGATDIINGNVTLIITSDDPAGPCIAVVDSMLLTIDSAAIANAGVNDTSCSGSTYTMSGSIGGSATSSAWSTTGDGTFNNPSLVNAIYTPGANDISNGTVNLVLTTNDPAGACGAVTDTMELTIAAPPVLVITDPVAVCQPSTIDLTDPAVTAGSTGGLTFNYYTNAAATIHVADSSAITATGTYYIVGRTALGCADTAAVNVVVNLAAVGGIASPDALVCSGANADTIELTNFVGAIQQWQSSTDGGITWINIVNTTAFQPYTNLTITTWYRAMLTATCASAVSEEARITVDPHPLSVGGTVTSNDTVCSGANGDTLTLSGHLGEILRWEYSIDGGNTWVYINNTTTSHIYSNLTTTTLFHAVVQNSVCGPAFSTNDTITVTTLSDAGNIVGAAPGCPDQTSGTLVLNGYSGAVLGWQYSTDGGTTWTDTLNLNDSLSYTNLADTTMYVAIVQAEGCLADTSVATAVIVYPKPLASFTADTVCLGTATNFTNTSIVAAGSIQFSQWDFGDNVTSLATNPVHTYSTLGIYTVNLITISNFGCQDTATATIVMDTLPNAQITSSGALSFCCGDSVTLSAMPGFNYLWSAGAATTQSITISNCTASGTYQLTVSDVAGGCFNTSSVNILIFPLPQVDAGNDTTINKGGSVLLNGQGALVYTWSPVINLINPGIANAVASPASTTTYILTGTDINGCVNSDSITIIVLADLSTITITNLLTTNGDGYNDYWYISDLENYPGTEVIIINREGQEVYYSSYYDNSWEGTNKNGKQLPDGTYYYFVKFPGTDKVYKGPITILNEK